MKATLAALAVVLALVLPGCSDAPEQTGGQGGGDGGGDGDAPQCTPGTEGCPCPEDMKAQDGTCTPADSILIDVQVRGSGSYEVGVPYPHGAWCLQGNDWLAGMRETHHLTSHEVRDVDRGKVLWLKGNDASQFISRVELGNRTPCQPVRHDPWSVDPDPAEDAVDVDSQAPVEVTIYLRTARGGCADLQQFQGPAQGGWTSVPRRFNNTSCS